MTQFFRLAALLAIAGVIYLTLGPVTIRSMSPFPALWDRSVAFVVIGVLLALAFPRHRGLVLVAVIVLAVGLELAQHLRPDRHGRIADAAIKVVGALLGVMLAVIGGKLLRNNPAGRNGTASPD